MKAKKNARDKRAEETRKRKEHWTRMDDAAPVVPVPPSEPVKPVSREEIRKRQEEETKEFLAYLESDIIIAKEERAPVRKGLRKLSITALNLEDGMPTVDEAIMRMNLGFQEMRNSGKRIVRLIHGYGSTGRGGKIRIGVREELRIMKRRGQIKDFIHGEDFGPTDESSRRLVERDSTINRDPDYGRMNHGITIVVL